MAKCPTQLGISWDRECNCKLYCLTNLNCDGIWEFTNTCMCKHIMMDVYALICIASPACICIYFSSSTFSFQYQLIHRMRIGINGLKEHLEAREGVVGDLRGSASIQS